jgi:hypothetical protein
MKAAVRYRYGTPDLLRIEDLHANARRRRAAPSNPGRIGIGQPGYS